VVEVEYHRPPDRTDRFRQELLDDGETARITLMEVSVDRAPVRIGPVHLPARSSVVWFTFPGRWYEVAALYGPTGELQGHYTNLIRPPEIEGHRWRITDLFLDLWSPARGEARVLDRAEFEEARRRGWIDRETAERAEATCRTVLARARAGDWPPAEVERWPLETLPALRLKRDEPGSYYANLVSTRIIAYGIYCLGAVALTSVGFAAFTNVFSGDRAARTTWLVTMGAEAAVLLPFALAGKLPAARRVRTQEVLTEHTLFLAAAVSAAAILAVHDSSLWRSLLSSVYATLALFLGVFATCRAYFDRTLPRLALAGLVVCLVALVFLL
jgi:hypothetical protein